MNGWQSVEPYIMENILESKRELKGHFSSELVNFLKKDPDSPFDYDLDPQPIVYCHDLEGLICHIASVLDKESISKVLANKCLRLR